VAGGNARQITIGVLAEGGSSPATSTPILRLVQSEAMETRVSIASDFSPTRYGTESNRESLGHPSRKARNGGMRESILRRRDSSGDDTGCTQMAEPSQTEPSQTEPVSNEV